MQVLPDHHGSFPAVGVSVYARESAPPFRPEGQRLVVPCDYAVNMNKLVNNLALRFCKVYHKPQKLVSTLQSVRCHVVLYAKSACYLK